MFEKLLKSAFDSGGEVFVYMNGFNNPLRGRIQDMQDEHFTLFQDGRAGTILWAFRLSDILSCGLLVGPPTGGGEIMAMAGDADEEEEVYNDSDN